MISSLSDYDSVADNRDELKHGVQYIMRGFNGISGIVDDAINVNKLESEIEDMIEEGASILLETTIEYVVDSAIDTMKYINDMGDEDLTIYLSKHPEDEIMVMDGREECIEIAKALRL